MLIRITLWFQSTYFVSGCFLSNEHDNCFVNFCQGRCPKNCWSLTNHSYGLCMHCIVSSINLIKIAFKFYLQYSLYNFITRNKLENCTRLLANLHTIHAQWPFIPIRKLVGRKYIYLEFTASWAFSYSLPTCRSIQQSLFNFLLAYLLKSSKSANCQMEIYRLYCLFNAYIRLH